MTIALPTESTRPIHCLQLGMHWFSHRAGGLDRYTAGLTLHRPSGASVKMLALRANSDDSGVPEFVRFYANDTDSAGERRNKLRLAFKEQMAAERFDVVASHFAQVAFPVRGRSRRWPDVPHVVHFHGPWAAESRREGGGRLSTLAKWFVERAVYARADRIICLSNAFARLLEQDYRIDRARIVVIPGGVDAAAFDSRLDRRAAREALGWPTSRPTVVCVRRLVRRMGLENLIDAISIARKTVPEILLKICGKGPQSETLALRIRDAGLRDHVALCGFVSDESLPLVYRAADVSIVPSEALEGFGLTTLESLAAGTPCLVTPVGGLPEAVSSLSPQLVLRAADPTALAQGLTEALRNPQTLPSSNDCHRYARIGFDWSVIANRVFQTYHVGGNFI